MIEKLFYLFVLINFTLQHSDYYHTTPEEIKTEVDNKIIFYGTVARIQNQQNRYFLHSHEVKYGSGSQQQSVTGMQNDNDYNSLWLIKECQGESMKTYTSQIKCGSCVRLEHMLTQRNLHSHLHNSPLSNNQEVSGYGEHGRGDIGDNWIIQCEFIKDDANQTFKASMQFKLRHQATNKYLKSNRADMFNHRNCGHSCPIDGQLEISATNQQGDDIKWKIHSGLFYLEQDNYNDEGRHCNQYGSCDDLDDDLDSDEFDIIDYSIKRTDL